MSKELVAVMVSAAFTVSVATIPGIQSWKVSVVGFVVTAILFVWWLSLHRQDVHEGRRRELEVVQRLDALTPEQYRALSGLVWRGNSTSVDRDTLERVRERTGLIERDFTGDFRLTVETAGTVRRYVKRKVKP